MGAIGYTIAAEGYLNFGFPGAFLLLMSLGMLIRTGMRLFSNHPSAAVALIMICWIMYSCMVVRNHLQLITGYIFFQVPVIAAVAYLLCKNEPSLEEVYLPGDAEVDPMFLESTDFESYPQGNAHPAS